MAQQHPKGLYLLFATEMAERFSYFGMIALLALYMTSALFPKDGASTVYGNFTSLVYLTPLVGGYISDHFWGNRRSIITGGTLMAIGQFFMFLSACFVHQSIYEKGGSIDPSVDNSTAIMLMYCGLGLLIAGNGFFKPNISTMVGDLYPQGDKRVESAFTIFYMGINIGALIAPLACGLFEGDYSDPGRFRWAFLIACIAISLSVITFSLLKSKFLVTPDGKALGVAPQPTSPSGDGDLEAIQSDAKENKSKTNNGNADVHPLRGLGGLTSSDWKHIGVILLLAVFTIAFWTAYGQAGLSLTYFTDDNTYKTFCGWEVPTSWLQTFPALFCVMLAPVMNWIWAMCGKHEPHPLNKLAIGLLTIGVAFLVMAFASDGMSQSDKISVMWLVFVYFIFEIGELALSPIGLSLVVKLSPKQFASLMMAMWYLSTCVSNKLAGDISAALYPTKEASDHYIFGLDVCNYHDFFLVFVIFSVVSALILFALTPWLKKLMQDIE